MKYAKILTVLMALFVTTTAVAQKKVELSLSSPVTISSGIAEKNQRILFSVELPEELTNVTIDYAKLTVAIDTNSMAQDSKGVGVALLPLTSSWTPDVSWSAGWDSPGGDIDLSAGQFLVASRAKTGVVGFQIAELVQSWVDGDRPNFGFMIRSSLEGQRDLVLLGENGNAQLTIYYTRRE